LKTEENFMWNWMTMPYRRYANFSGRSRRKEYWLFILFYLGVFAALVAIATAVGLNAGEGAAGGFSLSYLPAGLFILASLIPSLAVQVRRMHDQDRTGWWVLIGIIPVVNYIGVFVILVFMCLEGIKGDNRFGPDPKGAENLGDVFR
jgi:uncharacterized membrane protein YhaH (DUF805 family)